MADFARSVLAGVAVGVFTINALALETAVVIGMSTLETIKMRRQIAEEQDEAKRFRNVNLKP